MLDWDEVLNFKGLIPLKKVSLGFTNPKTFVYYDTGSGLTPEASALTPPLLFMHGAAGTSLVFFRQITTLYSHGYRCISFDLPDYRKTEQFLTGIVLFLDHLRLSQVILVGAGLGGYLAQRLVEYKPNRAAGLILINAFSDTDYFRSKYSVPKLLSAAPTFYVKKIFRDHLPQGEMDETLKDAVTFMSSQLDDLDRPTMISRLLLNIEKHTMGMLMIDMDRILIIESTDSSVPVDLTNEVEKRYSDAKVALLKSGHDFPYLVVPDEVALHVVVFLRNKWSSSSRASPQID